MAYVYAQHAHYVLLFLVLVVNSGFKFLRSYKPPIFMRSWVSVTDRGRTRNVQGVYMTDILLIQEKGTYTYTKREQSADTLQQRYRNGANVQ